MNGTPSTATLQAQWEDHTAYQGRVTGLPLFDHDFIDAVKVGNVPKVEELLAAGVNMNQVDANGTTPLFYAAMNGHEGVVRKLLAAGCDKDAMDDLFGYSPLHTATHNGDASIVWLLLAHNCAKNDTDYNGRTPLLVAAWKGHSGVLRELLAASCNKDQPDNDHATPLMTAIIEGHEGVVQQLLAAGCDANDANRDENGDDGDSYLCVAAETGHKEIVRRLLDAGGDMNKAGHYGNTPVILAARAGHKEVVWQLIAAGCDKDKASDDGDTPLIAAAMHGQWDMVRYLTGAVGFRVDVRDKFGATPLFRAAQHGHGHVVRELLAAGSSVNQSTPDGNTPLWAAVYGGTFVGRERQYWDVVDQLLAAGCDRDACREQEILHEPSFFPCPCGCHWQGASPLFVAAHEGAQIMVEKLLAAGSTLHLANAFHQTPLDIAKLRGKTDVVRLLQVNGMRTNFFRVLCGCEFLLPQLVTTEHIASLYKKSDIMQIILRVGLEEYQEKEGGVLV